MKENEPLLDEPLLEVSKLTLDYNLGKRKMRALDRVSFQIEKGEIVGVAGESGCGKSTLGLAIIKLLPKIASIRRGEILFEGQDLLKLSEEQMNKKIRGQKISMIFQNPQDALNPVFTIEKQMVDILHSKFSKRGIDIGCLEYDKVEESIHECRQKITVRQGLDKDLARKLVKLIKTTKLKVQSSIQGDQVRINGKKRDDLQDAIAFLKEQDLGLPLQYTNFRD